jgi:HSP20 family protein
MEESEMNTMTKENRQDVTQDEPSYLRPRVDITETREGYELRAEMPGVDKSGLELVLDGSDLTIVGRKPARTESLECIYRESSPSNYQRKFELDPAIDTSKVTARMEQGVLLLQLPKAERVKPRRIKVTD